jgi:hypothetical protein
MRYDEKDIIVTNLRSVLNKTEESEIRYRYRFCLDIIIILGINITAESDAFLMISVDHFVRRQLD